ncbi:flavodoxin [uncultured Roseburia sp.]|nr:flavodoxin [uncultured Roseburia sp.]
MKILVAYFSQSGNTKLIAEHIAAGISEVAECDLMDIRDVDVRMIRTYDLIGVGGPAIGAEADIVKRFVYSIPLTGGQMCFLFNTHGSLPRRYFPEAIRRMKDREFNVIGWQGFYASVHIQCFPSPYYTDGHPDEQDIADARQFGKDMAARAERIANGETDLIPEVPPLEPPKPYSLPHTGKDDTQARGIHGDRRYDPSKCLYPKCHLCMDNCPEGFIDFSKEPRQFGSHCDICKTNECCYCELICPTGAIYITDDDIEYGLNFLKEHHDFFEATLNQEEAEGKFRRLVPVEEVGWDTPYNVRRKNGEKAKVKPTRIKKSNRSIKPAEQ